MPKEKKPKSVNFKLIPENGGNGLDNPHEMLNKVRQANHRETIGAKVGMAWRIRTSSDKDGRLVLGRCVKVSDMHREFAKYDFIIVLNKEVWDDPEFTKGKKIALLDHEMCHAAADYDDETGEHKRDDRNRLLFRTRKHDIEEFRDIVARHGCYKRDLENFAEALLSKNDAPWLFNKDEKRPEAVN